MNITLKLSKKEQPEACISALLPSFIWNIITITYVINEMPSYDHRRRPKRSFYKGLVQCTDHCTYVTDHLIKSYYRRNERIFLLI